jgi:uncharacterized membrane-anchored protein
MESTTLNEQDTNKVLEKLVVYIAKELKRGVPKSDLINALCEETEMDQTTATNLVETVEKGASEQDESKDWNGGASIIWGLLFLIGGIVATAASEGQVLWYGAIILGVIYLIKGALGK